MPWSFNEDRRFMEITAASKSIDEVVKRTRRKPETVRSAAIRLGVKLGDQIDSDYQLRLWLQAQK
jgi:hypothetical protein